MTKDEIGQIVTEVVEETCNHYNSDSEQSASTFAASILNDIEKIIAEVLYRINN